MLRLRGRPEAVSASLAHHAPLDAETKTVLAFVFRKTLGAAPGRDHLRRLVVHCLLYLTVFPLETRLIHDRVVFEQPRS